MLVPSWWIARIGYCLHTMLTDEQIIGVEQHKKIEHCICLRMALDKFETNILSCAQHLLLLMTDGKN